MVKNDTVSFVAIMLIVPECALSFLLVMEPLFLDGPTTPCIKLAAKTDL